MRPMDSDNGLFSKWCQNNWTLICQKKKKELDLTLVPYANKQTSKLTKDLKIKYKTIQLLKKNMGEDLHDWELHQT